MRPSRITHVTATGDVTTSTSYLRNVILTAGSDVASVEVRAGGQSGTLVLALKADPTVGPLSVSSGRLHDAQCIGGIHVTLTGTDAAVTIVHI